MARLPFQFRVPLLALAVLLLTAMAALAAPPAFRCVGFDEPMNRSPINIGKGRVLPLRAKLAATDGTFGDNTVIKAPPVIHLVFQPEGGPEEDKSGNVEVRDYGKGNRFVFDQEAHWKFDLGTGNLEKEGKYVVTLLTGDANEYTVDPTCTLVFMLRGGKGSGSER